MVGERNQNVLDTDRRFELRRMRYISEFEISSLLYILFQVKRKARKCSDAAQNMCHMLSHKMFYINS